VYLARGLQTPEPTAPSPSALGPIGKGCAVKRLLVLGFTLVTVLLSATYLDAAPKGKGAAPRPKKDRGDDFPPAMPNTEMPPSFADDMDKLKEQLALSPAQVTKLAAMREKRNELLAKQEQANRKRIESARTRVAKIKKAADKQRMTRELDAYIKRLDRTRQTMAAQHERTMFAVLTPDQKTNWNAPILQVEVEKALAELNLTGEQKSQIQKLCETQAKRTTVPASATASAATITLLTNQANLRVLTPEQKREYAKIRAAKFRDSRRRPKG